MTDLFGPQWFQYGPVSLLVRPHYKATDHLFLVTQHLMDRVHCSAYIKIYLIITFNIFALSGLPVWFLKKKKKTSFLIWILILWIELILLKLKIENWKHYSKIIFKCMNSTVGPIFNEKVDEEWNLWVSWTVHRSTDMTENELKSQIMRLLYINSRRTISAALSL